MNNIFLPNDPLLYNQQPNDYRQLYEQKLMREREMFDRQYQEYMNSLHKPEKPAPAEDKIRELNDAMSSLTPETKAELQKNKEFIDLHQAMQECVQTELVSLVRETVNSNPNMVTNINRQIQIINELSDRMKDQDRKNMAQINDYLQNYSDMTFDEYKKLKNI